MRARITILMLAMLPCLAATAQNDNEWCRGLKNPTAFTITGVNSANAQWYGYEGSRDYRVSTCDYWGTSFPESGRQNANVLETRSSGSSCTSSGSQDIHGQSDNYRRFVIKGSGHDPLTSNRLSYLPPDPSFTSSIRLGNNCGGSHEAEMLCYQFQVRPKNALVTIWYALSLQNGQHSASENPEFDIVVEKQTGGTWTRIGGDTLCYLRPTPAGSNSNVAPFYVGSTGTHTGASYGCNIYLPWNKVVINLGKYLYQTVRIKIGSGDCQYYFHYAYAYIAGECQPVEISTSGCPRGATAVIDTLRAPTGLSNYVWYRSDIDGGRIANLNNVPDTVPFVALTNGTLTSPDTHSTFLCDTSHFRVHLRTLDGRDSVGLTNNQVFRCDMTSYMNPSLPITSKAYVRVINTKPLIAVDSVKTCESSITLINKSFVPNRMNGCDTTLTEWWFYEGANENTPLAAHIEPDIANERTTGKAYHQYDLNTRGIRAVKMRAFSADPPADPNEERCYTDQTFKVRILGRPVAQLQCSSKELCDSDIVTLTDVTPGSVRRDWIFETRGIKDTIPCRRSNCQTTYSRNFAQEINPVGLMTYNGDFARDSINTYDTIWCTGTVYDTITVFSHPEIMREGDSIVCRGEKTDITVSTHTPNCTFKWYRTYMGSQPIATGPRLQVAPYADTCIYYILVTSEQQCTAWDSVHAFMVIPTFYVDKNVICAGDSVTLYSGGAEHYSWSANPPDASLSAQLDSLTGFGPTRMTVKPKSSTTYTLVGHGTNGCSATPLTQYVDVHPLPVARYSSEPGFVDSDAPEVTFNDVSPYSVKSMWFFPNCDTARVGSPLTHNFGELSDTSVPIRLVAFNDLGCTDTLDFSIPVVLFTFYAPNIFTPERPDNNTFRIFTTNEMEHFHVTVYDRRGQMVYKSDELNFEWDGNRMDGEKCPQGAYVYVITYRRPMTEDIVTQKGTITIIR